MAVLEQSPWYQEIIRRGEERERQRWQVFLEQERQEWQQERLQTILRLVQRRFGGVPETMEAQLQALSAEQLQALVEEVVMVNTLEELAAHLPPPAAANGANGANGSEHANGEA